MKRIHSLKDIPVKEWSLFLDRDGVINVRPDGDYVKKPEEFFFIEGVPQAIATLNQHFKHTFVVTNQQGIGRGVMNSQNLGKIHKKMTGDLLKNDAHIDRVFYCPDLASSNSLFRKPNSGMALQARKEFRDVNFKRSVMVGDAISDMLFGKKVGMTTVFISNNTSELKKYHFLIDFVFPSLPEFAKIIRTA